MKVVGKSAVKVDGVGLVCGTRKFVDDFDVPGTLVGKILASPHAHAQIKRIDTSRAEKMPGVHAVLCYKNVPRIVHTTAGQGYPEPSPYDTFIFDKKVRYAGDRVAAVAADSAEIAAEALKLIKVDYDVLPAILDAKQAMNLQAPVIHDEPEAKVVIPVEYNPGRNIAAHVKVGVGDMAKGFRKADVIVKREYKAHYAQHCPIEPHISLSYLDEDGRLVIVTSTQVPFHARRIVAQALDLPLKNVRVIKPRIGGGFGSKQEVLLEQVCAALTLACRQPVKMRYTREEDIVSSRTRHEQYITMKIGAKQSGKLTAISMNVLSNTGAYGAHALTVASNCGSKTLPLYPCDNVEFEATTVYTNKPVGGAYRGYGATQAAFALEAAMDELAYKLEMDPVELRRKNHIRSGGTSPIFQKLGEGKPGVQQTIGSCKLDECIRRGMREIKWKSNLKKSNAERKSRKTVKHGVGVACLMQGSSIPEIDMGAATIKMNEDGSFNLLVGATDLGTGSDTVLAQIAAEVLGAEAQDMIVYSSDTDMTPFDVGAYASSTTYLSGNAVINTAEAVKEQILSVAAEITGESTDNAVLEKKHVVLVSGRRVPFTDIASRALYTRNQFQIGATRSHVSHKSPPPFAAHFAEVDVDTETGEVTLLKYVAAVDCGTEINPKLARGQTEGAVVNGIGYALSEEFIFNEKGRMVTDSLFMYKIPGTRDLPELVTIHVPSYEDTGPFGAKSVSEISINGALPAISNAIYNATGARLTEGPFTAERVLKAIRTV
jgi:putative selenate reductase molybdopterin-binding subunit